TTNIFQKVSSGLRLLRRHAVRDGFVSPFGSQLEIVMTVAQLDVDAPITSVVTIVRRPISNQILRAKLVRDLCKRALEGEHLAGEEIRAAVFFTKSVQVFLASVVYV